jgi:hypothetical protein
MPSALDDAEGHLVAVADEGFVHGGCRVRWIEMQLWCVKGNQELRIVPQPPDWQQDKKNGRRSGINQT